MRNNKSLFLTSLIFVFFIVGGLVFFFFWRLRVLKIEAKLSEEGMLVKERAQFINSYNFKEFSDIIKTLSVEEIEISPISTNEIGREKLFQ